jgi:tRNA pseudouridine55 synthase
MARFFTHLDKVYEGEIHLGKTSDTYDLDGQVSIIDEHPGVERAELESVFRSMKGEQEQFPPPYSAIRVKGKRLYEYARKGKEVEIPSRRVNVMEFQILEYTTPTIKFRVRVSSGTYIRSLAHDLGQKLGCGALLAALRRTDIGKFSVNTSMDIAPETIPEEQVRKNLVTIFDACEFLRRVIVTDEARSQLVHGRQIPVDVTDIDDIATIPDNETYVLFDSHHEIVALAEPKRNDAGRWVLAPRRVLISKDR